MGLLGYTIEVGRRKRLNNNQRKLTMGIAGGRSGAKWAESPDGMQSPEREVPVIAKQRVDSNALKRPEETTKENNKLYV